jgi:hypothetical protein
MPRRPTLCLINLDLVRPQICSSVSETVLTSSENPLKSLRVEPPTYTDRDQCPVCVRLCGTVLGSGDPLSLIPVSSDAELKGPLELLGCIQSHQKHIATATTQSRQ